MKRLAAFLLTIFFATATHADTLGRLFFTSAQRAQLEREQAQVITADDKPISTPSLDGIVQRSDGARTVWINGIAQKADGHSAQAPDVHAMSPQQDAAE